MNEEKKFDHSRFNDIFGSNEEAEDWHIEAAKLTSEVEPTETVEVKHYEPETGETWTEKMSEREYYEDQAQAYQSECESPVKKTDGAKESTELLTLIIDALSVRHWCSGSQYMSKADATAEYFDMLAVSYQHDDSLEHIARGKKLLEAGTYFFDCGYRLKTTDRNYIGVSMKVPDEALAWRTVDAGHIATSRAFSIEYVVKNA